MAYILLALSLAGILDTVYLTSAYYAKTELVCDLIDGCNTVMASVYSSLGAVPLSLIGLIYYSVIFLLIFDYLNRKQQSSLQIAVWLSGAGFLISLYLVYLQIFVIKAICQYCMLSALISALLFIILGSSVLLFRRQRPLYSTPNYRQMKNKEENLNKILDYLRSHNRITNNEVEKMLGVSSNTAENYLDELEKQGRIKQIGKTGRGVYYELNK